MRDEDFQVFIDEFGEATHRIEVQTVSIEKWQGKLSNQLLAYWQTEGWSSYANGLFWTVNPEEYEDIVDEWLENSPLEQIDAFHVIARSAFGHLYLWGEKTGASATISPSINSIICLASNLKRKLNDADFYTRTFFSNKTLNDCDYNDEFGVPLFTRALAKLGPLGADEVYGFEPAIVLGGKMQLDNLAKLNLDVHLTILRQLAAPTMPFSNIDADKIIKSME